MAQRWKQMGLYDSDIAIVTRTPLQTARMLQQVRPLLKARGYKTSFAVAHSQGNKRNIIQKQAVSVLSYASSKGLEFPAVLVLGLEAYQPQLAADVRNNELYVALTRARSELVVSWNKPCQLSELLATQPYVSLVQPLLGSSTT